MNRDQWNLKILREMEILSGTGATYGRPVGEAIVDRRAGAGDRRGINADRRSASGSRRGSTGERAMAVSLAERYGGCCEWGLFVKSKTR